jgi:iron(III) transport system ATP-binding protein
MARTWGSGLTSCSIGWALQFGRERGRDLQSSEQIAWPSPRRPGGALINGREVAEAQRFVPPERRNVVLMFQDFALFPHQTIIENVCFWLAQLPREDACREVSAALARVHLSRQADDYPHILSGGEQLQEATLTLLRQTRATLLPNAPAEAIRLGDPIAVTRGPRLLRADRPRNVTETPPTSLWRAPFL